MGGRNLSRTIAQYQNAFNNIIDSLKKNEDILSVMVLGSLVTGDLWEESDIDMLVVSSKNPSSIKNLYLEELGIPIHMKIMNKERFLSLHENNIKNGTAHKVFYMSRLVFSKDDDITNKYNRGRYYLDLDRDRWSMVYLGKLIKSIVVCKKYLSNEGMYTAFNSAVKCIEEYSKLYANCSGYMVTTEAISMVANLDIEFKKVVDKLYFENSDNKKDVIKDTIEFIEQGIDKTIKLSTSMLMEFMTKKDTLLSAEDIKSDDIFRNFDIDMEEILNELWKKNIIKKDVRDYRSDNGKVIFKENVYFI